MNYSEDTLEKQRQIGKQLLLVRLFKSEGERERKIGLRSSISFEEISNWASMDIDEVKLLADTWSRFESMNLFESAAMNFVYYSDNKIDEKDAIVFDFVFTSYKQNGMKFIKEIKPNLASDEWKKMSRMNYKQYESKRSRVVINEIMTSTEFYKKMMIHCMFYYVEAIRKALQNGFDWDVIREMSEVDISKERYNELESICVSPRA